MFNVKQMGVAAATILFAGAAMASNFRAGDQIYVPAAGHAASASATFISDVYVSNLTGDSVDVSVIYATGGYNGAALTQQSFRNAFTLQPNERREMNDFMVNTLHLSGNSLGQLIFNACKAGADCTPDANGLNVNYRNISVESRIYSIPNSAPNPATAPTTGQLFSGIPWYNYVSEASATAQLNKVFITGIRANSQYRTNMGFVNASQFSTTTLTAKLYSGSSPEPAAPIATQAITLAPFGWVQLTVGTSLFNGYSGTGSYVTVEQGNTQPTSDAASNGCQNGCPAFLAYGSQLDNQTTDATTLEAQYTQALTANAITCIYSPDTAGCSSKAGQGPRRAVSHSK